MPTDLTVVLTDEPGQLAKLGEATGDAGVNIQVTTRARRWRSLLRQ
jgi:hypothetical protein